ncbi:MAG: hypothetical protein HQK53_02370 [Oligoflexia bacterium]|nr:hypothetical protein [Oligoflexia bacterium]
MSDILSRLWTVIFLSLCLSSFGVAFSITADAIAADGTSVSSGGPGKGGLDPRVRVILTTAMYGTVGGALLGAASIAYGTELRAIAIGASLGLYAGLFFGGYVVSTHYLDRQDGTILPASPYQEPGAMGAASDLRDNSSKMLSKIGNTSGHRIGSTGPTGPSARIGNDLLFYLDFIHYRF